MRVSSFATKGKAVAVAVPFVLKLTWVGPSHNVLIVCGSYSKTKQNKKTSCFCSQKKKKKQLRYRDDSDNKHF